MNKIILKDKTTYEIAEGTGIGAVTITVDSYEALKPIEDAFLKEGNLEKVTFMIDDQINGEYTNLKLVSKTFEDVYTNEEGKVVVTIALTEMTENDIAIRELQRGQAIQDSAIADLGDVVSEITPEEV